MKAAASGILQASVHLGKMYVRRAVKDGKKQYLLNASEWFELAASSGHGDTLVDMAKVCRDQATATTPSGPVLLDMLNLKKQSEEKWLEELSSELDRTIR